VCQLRALVRLFKAKGRGGISLKDVNGGPPSTVQYDAESKAAHADSRDGEKVELGPAPISMY